MKFLLSAALLIVFSTFVISSVRIPRNRWLIIYNENESVYVTAESVEDAVTIFRREYKRADVHSVARPAFVESIWITEPTISHSDTP